MRTFAVAVALAWSLSAFAQEPSNSSAKQAYAALTKSLEKLKTLDPAKSANAYKTELERAQKKIDAIKEKEPGFDVSAQEQALKDFAAVLEQAGADKVAAKEAKQKEHQEKTAAAEAARLAREAESDAKDAASAAAGGFMRSFEETFRPPREDRYREAADPAAELKPIAERFAAFAATDPAEKVKQAVAARRYVEPRFVSEEKFGYDRRLAEVTKGLTAPSDNRDAIGSYWALREYELFWNTLEKALPDDEVVRANAAMTRKAVAESPSLDAAKGKAAASQQAALAKVKLPPAARKDAAMEALVRKAFTAEGWNEEILQVNLLDTDWHIEKNKLTGAIICRYQSAAIKAKNKAGKCIAYQMSVKQDWDGSGYSATARRYGHNAQYMACEN